MSTRIPGATADRENPDSRISGATFGNGFAIDGSFVRALSNAEAAHTIVRSVAEIGNRMGLETTAEGIGRNAAELVRKVKAAQYVAAHPGEVCPAKWEEGEDTLQPGLDLVGKI